MDIFFRSIPVLLIFPTLAALTWIRGGTQGDLLVPTVPWLLTLVFEVIICFPQRHYGEDAVQARQRCWRRIGRDPVFFLTLFFLVIVLGIPFLNQGLCPTCDYGKILMALEQEGVNTSSLSLEEMLALVDDKAPNPLVPFAPFCVNLRHHFEVFMWFLPALTAMLAARHALLRPGKRMLVEMLVWNAAALAVFGFVQRATGAKFVMMWDQAEYEALIAAINKPLTDVTTGKPLWGYIVTPDPHFFATFGYPNMAGSFFMLAFAVSIGVWMTHVMEVESERPPDKVEIARQRLLLRFIRAHYMLIPVTLNFLGALFTYSRMAIVTTLVMAVLAFVYYVLRLLLARVDRARQVKRAAVSFVGAVLLLVVGVVFAPENVLDEISTTGSHEAFNRLTGKNDYQASVALKLVKKYPAFGCGGWGYKHLCLNQMSADEKGKINSMGPANVHNDYLQFLCEHGFIGFGCLLGIFFCLVVPIFRDWGRLYRASRFLATGIAPSSPRAIYCISPGIFWILVGCFSVALHAVLDAPLRSGAVLGLFFVSLACADGFLPHQLEARK